MNNTLKTLAIGGLISLTMTTAHADTVTLRTENNSVQLSGELMSFDGTTYVLKTSVGELNLAANGLICEGDACPVEVPALDFVVSGAGGVSDVVFPALLSAFATANGAALNASDAAAGIKRFGTALGGEPANIDVASNTSAQGYTDLIEGSASLVLANRSVTGAEAERLAAAGITEVREHTLGIDALSIVTSKDNVLPSISIDDVSRMFSGEIQNWSQVGGPDAPIALYARDGASGIAEVFQTLVLGPSGRNLSSDITTFGSDLELSQKVATDPFGIGFTRFAADNSARQMPIIGQCGLVVTPSEFNIRAEEYPLSYRMRAVTTGRAQSELLEQMIAFAPSDAAQTALATSGRIGQNLTSSPVDQQGMRFASALQSDNVVESIPLLQQMVSEMVVSERLSSTFRFEPGSRTLDERGLRDVERVVALLNAETANGASKSVRIMGFTDSLGNSELNQELSKRRAQQVLDALLERDPELANKVSFLPMGFGEISPIGCDQSTTGRWINRRVEIWISAAAK